MTKRTLAILSGGDFRHRCVLHWSGFCLAVVLAITLAPPVFGGAPTTTSPATILQDLQSFREMGSVLYVAAHPDDENTTLIAYLARGRNYRTAYLSLTRGAVGRNGVGGAGGVSVGG